MIIDTLMARYEFRTHYTRHVAADPRRVWDALGEITYQELPVTRLLLTVRTGGGSRPTGSVVQAMPMPVLGHEEGRELVVGAVRKFWQLKPTVGPRSTTTADGFRAFDEPGWAKAAMSVHVQPDNVGGTVLVADTRVVTTDARSRRIFAPYWLLIKIGGAGFIRLEMLRAVARRAES